jgi:hypothetical protein
VENDAEEKVMECPTCRETSARDEASRIPGMLHFVETPNPINRWLIRGVIAFVLFLISRGVVHQRQRDSDKFLKDYISEFEKSQRNQAPAQGSPNFFTPDQNRRMSELSEEVQRVVRDAPTPPAATPATPAPPAP